MSLRAGIVVTGTEVLTGRTVDRNGPWLVNRLMELGVDVGRLSVVGDRPEDLATALREFLPSHDLVITTGGLGPTADDLTTQVVADVLGRPMHLDPTLEGRITAIIEELTARYNWRRDPEAMAVGIRKQATVPQDAVILEPTGTAPGVVVTSSIDPDAPPVIVLPGPPGELQPMWPVAVATPAVQEVLKRAEPLRQRTIRLWRVLEADLAKSLRTIESRVTDLEISTCLRDGGELEIVTRYPSDVPGIEGRYDLLKSTVLHDFSAQVFSDEGATVDDVVADRLTARGWTIGTAESCTGGLLAGRLTDRPGSSSYVNGGVVVYTNQAKTRLAGVPAELIAEHGAVSREVAEALAAGAREAMQSDVGVGITGIAGPDGGTPDKPVGTVHLAIATPAGVVTHRELHYGGTRSAVRQRTVVTALHEVRLALAT